MSVESLGRRAERKRALLFLRTWLAHGLARQAMAVCDFRGAELVSPALLSSTRCSEENVVRKEANAQKKKAEGRETSPAGREAC